MSCPSHPTGVDPRGAHPTARSILGRPGEVSVHQMAGHFPSLPIAGLALSAGSRGRLASCGEDGAIRLWDLESGEPLQTLRRDRLYERLTITGIRGLTEAQKASLRALGAFEDTSVGR